MGSNDTETGAGKVGAVALLDVEDDDEEFGVRVFVTVKVLDGSPVVIGAELSRK